MSFGRRMIIKKLIFIFAILFWAVIATAQNLFFEKKEIALKIEAGFHVSEWVEFDVPHRLVSMQILLRTRAGAFLQVTDLIDPNGRQYVKSSLSSLNAYSIPSLQNTLSLNRSEGVLLGYGSLIYPNAPQLPSPTPGRWKLRGLLSGFVTDGQLGTAPHHAKIDVQILGKKNSEHRNSNLNIRIQISDQSSWKYSKDLVEQIEFAKQSFSEIGINLSVLSVETISTQFKDPLSVPLDIQRLSSSKNVSDTVNVYLLPPMAFQLKPVNGIACIGGPVGIDNPCFVALFADPSRYGEYSNKQIGKILAHELGHYLGLFHTQDDGYMKVGVVYDSLPDTPEEITGLNMMDPGIHNHNPSFSKSQIQMMFLSPVLTD